MGTLSRSSTLAGAFIVACAGGDANQPAGATLGSSASAGSSTDVATTGISATSTSAPDPTATSEQTSSTGTDPTSDPTSSGSLDEGSSSGEPMSGLNRYSLDTATGSWTQAPLREVWVGSNAPPSTGVVAAVSLTRFDRLLVATEDGTIYERSEGLWQTPLPLAERFPLAAGLELEAMAHSPGQGAGGETREDIYLVDSPTAVFYTQLENGGLEDGQVFELSDEDGPPQASVDFAWSIAETDPSLIGRDPQWLIWHHAFTNGEVWRFTAGGTWTEYSLPANAYFDGTAGQPDPTTVRAAFFDDAVGVAHFIAP